MSYYSTVIIVLGCDEKRSKKKLVGAIRVYNELVQKNEKPLILYSGFDYKQEQIKRLVDAVARMGYEIFVEPNSRTTIENALFSYERIKEIKPEKLIIVTDSVHYKRAKYIFEKIVKDFSKSYEIVETFNFLKTLLNELVALPYDFLRLSFNIYGKFKPLEKVFRRKN